ncbi:MAG TPA: sulfatase-like hydrolase/transferase [Planctomycetota bacterium]|nr:sulfatase-like hydrolase/transferase [Planctomycetota bacterium]
MSDASTTRERLAIVAWQYLATLVVLTVIARHYFAGEVDERLSSSLSTAAAAMATVATMAALAVPALLVAAGAALVPRAWVARWLGPLPFALTLALVYADTVIWRLYHRHVDGFVLELLTTPAAHDSFTVGLGTWLNGALAIAAMALAPYLAGIVGPRLSVTRRRAWWWSVAAALLAVIIADKGLFAWADMTNRIECTRVRTRLPLYQAVTAKRFASRFGVAVARESGFTPLAGGGLDWPKAPLSAPADAPRPNILIVAIEGCRFDMLDAQVMPNLHAYAERAIVGENHFSGGNASRCGIFSLLYGLWGTAFPRVLDERRSPLLIDQVVARGYAMRVLSCTDLNFPEFRKTAFVGVPEAITDRWDAPRVDRDRLMTDALCAFVGERRAPFFAFAFYDAPHQPYLYPEAHARFAPVCDPSELDYIKLAADPGPSAALLRNRYRNAMGYVDAQLARVFAALDAAGVADETIVVVAGDHGEEFAESGRRVGHNNAYTRWQTQTAFVMRVPGAAPRRIARLTSHVDVAPTLMARLGIANPVGDYSHGRDLLGDGVSAYVVMAGWDDAAVLDDRGIAVFGTASTDLGFARFDRDYQPADVGPGGETLVEVMERMAFFTK